MAAGRTRNSFRRAASHVKVTDGRRRAEGGGSAVPWPRARGDGEDIDRLALACRPSSTAMGLTTDLSDRERAGAGVELRCVRPHVRRRLTAHPLAGEVEPRPVAGAG